MFTAIRRSMYFFTDLSGTIADNVGLKVKQTMQKVWDDLGLPITLKDIQLGMGKRKDEHFDSMSLQVLALIRRKHPSASAAELEQLRIQYRNTALKNYADEQVAALKTPGQLLIPEKMAVLKKLASLNPALQFGLNTGFYRAQAQPIFDQFFAARITHPARVSCVTGSEVPNGRPAVDMICNLLKQAQTPAHLRTLPVENYNTPLEKFSITERHKVITVDDTGAGIEAGKNFGCFTVLALEHSSHLNFNNLAEINTHPEEYRRQLQALIQDVARPLAPDYVTTTPGGWLSVYYDVCERLAYGSVPGDRAMTVVSETGTVEYLHNASLKRAGMI